MGWPDNNRLQQTARRQYAAPLLKRVFYGPGGEPTLPRNPRRRLIGWILVACILPAACTDVEPAQAKGLDVARLNSVTLGMSREAAVSILGEPLEQVTAIDAPGREALWYAKPGARWILGEYRTKTRGHEVVIWFQDNKLSAARVAGAPNGPLCECRVGACATGWATSCAALGGSKS